MSKRRNLMLWLTAVVILGLGLRVWGLSFGLPYTYHYDEHFYINTALNLGAGVVSNPPYAAVGLSNILFGEYAGYYVVGHMLGVFSSPANLEAAYRSDPSVFYLLGRLTAAALGTTTVVALYVLGKTIADTATGLLAAAILAVSFLHVRDSHYAVPDIAMTFLVVMAVALAAVSLRARKRRFVYLAALAGGLAVAMKWTGLPVAATVWWASIHAGHKPTSSMLGRLLNRAVLFTGLLFAAGFALGSPQVLYNPAPYLNEALGQVGAGQAGGFEIWQVDTVSGWLFYAKTLLYGIGIVLLVLGVAGVLRRLVMALRIRDEMSVLLVAFPVTYYLLMGATRHYFARYALPLVPFLVLFAAEIIIALLSWAGTKRRRLGLGLAVVLVLTAIAQPLAYTIRHDLLLTRDDTRTLAKDWIEAHLPEGARIAVDWPVHGPPLSTAETRVPGSTKVYEVTVVGGVGLSDHPIDWYKQHGFEWLVVSSFIYDIHLVDQQQDTERQAFYAALDQELKLVREFRPRVGPAAPSFIFDEIYGPAVGVWQRDRPGPVIKVFEVIQP